MKASVGAVRQQLKRLTGKLRPHGEVNDVVGVFPYGVEKQSPPWLNCLPKLIWGTVTSVTEV